MNVLSAVTTNITALWNDEPFSLTLKTETPSPSTKMKISIKLLSTKSIKAVILIAIILTHHHLFHSTL